MYTTRHINKRIHGVPWVLALGLLAWLAGSALAAAPVVSSAAVAQVSRVLESHRDTLLQQPGVNAVGVGLMPDGITVGVHIYVQEGQATGALPRTLDGVPVQVFTRSRPFVAHQAAREATQANETNHQGSFPFPVPMGVSTGNINSISAGTLGYRVRRIGDPDAVGYVTNNHVAAADADGCPASLPPTRLPVFGTAQCHPGRLDAEDFICEQPQIGALTQVIPLVLRGSFMQTVDGAFVRSRRGCVSSTIAEIGVPNEPPAMPQLGAVLWLSGRSSGLIQIQVAAINATVFVEYEGCGTAESDRVARFVNQAVTIPLPPAQSASLPGDSGAPVVQRAGPAGRSITPVGLNFAGDDFFGIINPAPLVFEALGVEIDTAPDAPPSGMCF